MRNRGARSTHAPHNTAARSNASSLTARNSAPSLRSSAYWTQTGSGAARISPSDHLGERGRNAPAEVLHKAIRPWSKLYVKATTDDRGVDINPENFHTFKSTTHEVIWH